jgi:leader peptidase (prepilin peptidase) / N-methyltransferase
MPISTFPFEITFIACSGLILGSFLNVVIHRLPREESVVFPNSRCPECSTAIPFYDNIPVISYLILGGRCRNCKTGISLRYPAVELLTAVVYVALYLSRGLSVSLAFDLAFATAIIALIFIDAEHMILPNAITYPGFALALVLRLFIPNLDGVENLWLGPLSHWPLWAVSLLGAVLGAITGGGSLWLTGWVWEKLRGIEAMGLGDVKMMLMVGAWLGWRLTVVTIFFAVFSGSLVGIAMMIIKGERDLQMRLPFGIFLGTGTIVALLFGTNLVNWYISHFIPQ